MNVLSSSSLAAPVLSLVLGWIDEDSLSQILSSLPSPLSASRGRDPGAAFRGDTVMSDALVSDSASAGSHSL
ncbi:hypothetical protein G6F61_013423 [Rhizopus arrhizus]|uniref:Secreted protein n=1 Tax=Rhizopus oryzae TaxID=64495 RepID=A0A9P6WTR8_RHIOR|nr:hypothetical protein G6F65_022291 [Rhizopus arrhizus]KAG1285325.1 hypothetical protein G6F64_014262 [Rhizopus arrhizus]KAG1365979.1 hypothetical protein G6F61_013423 [Rhizopus arrhizus]